jgi:hypothetical protein
MFGQAGEDQQHGFGKRFCLGSLLGDMSHNDM